MALNTKCFTFADGTQCTFNYEDGDQIALEALSDAIIQDKKFPEVDESGSYINKLVSVSNWVQ